MISSHSVLSKLINGGIYDNASIWAIPLSIIQLLSVFFLMGAISEDFLALNVNLLCNSSNLLVSVLMAFCNSSPDLISNFVAWYSSAKLEKGSDSDVSNTADTLAISEVMGACGTILFMAIGFILLAFNKLYKKILIQRFEYENINGFHNGEIQSENDLTDNLRTVTNASLENRINQFVNEVSNQQYSNELTILLRPLLNKLSNDMIFFSLGFSLILMCCKIKSISLFVCVALLVLYFMFMLNSIRHHKKHVNDTTNYESSLADQIEMENTDAFDIDNQEEADMIFKNQMEENNSFFENDNFNFFVSMFDSEEFKETNLSNEDIILEEQSNVWDTNEDPRDVLKLSNKAKQSSDRLSNIKNHTNSFTYSDNPSEPNQIVENAIIYDKTTENGIMKKFKDSIVFHYIERKRETFQKNNILKKIIFLMTEPILALAVAVCPRYNKAIPKKEDSYLVLTIQCYTCMFFTVFVFSTFIKRNYLWFDFALAFVLGSILMAVQVRMRIKYKKISEFSLNRPLTGAASNDHRLATSERICNTTRYEEFINESTLLLEFRLECCIFSLVGIINSIFWIVILSNNLIQIIEFYQKQFNISETILGMTLFAWGNSVPDILSNVAVLKLYANDIPQGLDQIPTLLYKWQVQSLVKYCHISIVTCISSSTINSMIGIGFNALIAILKKRPFEITWSLKDISKKTQIHLLITSSSVLIYAMIVALILKIFVKNKQLLEKYIIDGYFNNREVVIEESKDGSTMENGKNNLFKLKFNKFLKFFGIYVIFTWLCINFINVIIEILL